MFYLMDEAGDYYYINPFFDGYPFLEKKKVGYHDRREAEYALSELRNICVKNSFQLNDADSLAMVLDRLYVSTGLRRKRRLVGCSVS